MAFPAGKTQNSSHLSGRFPSEGLLRVRPGLTWLPESLSREGVKGTKGHVLAAEVSGMPRLGTRPLEVRAQSRQACGERPSLSVREARSRDFTWRGRGSWSAPCTPEEHMSTPRSLVPQKGISVRECEGGSQGSQGPTLRQDSRRKSMETGGAERGLSSGPAALWVSQ